MARKLKLLSGLSTLALTGAVALAGCSGEGEGAEGEAAATGTTASLSSEGEGEGAMSEGEGEGSAGGAMSAGEGEGGEGEGAAPASAVDDKTVYLQQLMLIRGHLKAGADLYAAGDATKSATHMKHPKDELYTNLKPALDARGAKGFDKQLLTLSSSVADGESVETMQKNLAAVREAIDAAAAAADPTPQEVLLASAKVLRTAGDEFDIGVKGGKVVNVHEYQDAYGFMSTVVEKLGALEAPDGATDEAIGAARDQAAKALEAAPSVTPPEQVEAVSSTIYGAAARIEIAALGLE